jgi:hypothetical protein
MSLREAGLHAQRARCSLDEIMFSRVAITTTTSTRSGGSMVVRAR